MSTYRSRLSFQIKRIRDFWRNFRRSKRGIFGIGILSFYIFLALAAPLLTPNDPAFGFYVAGDFAVPVWFKYLPGGERLNENFILSDDPGFTKITTLFENWKFETSSPELVSYVYEPNVGGGSAAVVFRRKDPWTLADRVEAHLTAEFPWPYDPPRRFYCNITVYAKGVELVPAIVQVTIRRVGEEPTYPPFWNLMLDHTTMSGIKPYPRLDSYVPEFKARVGGEAWSDPAKIVFSEPANYLYDISIIFMDNNKETLGKSVEAIVYFDDLNIRCYGTAYGLLGTDYRGRDIFAQFVYGARVSLQVGLLSAILSVVIGLIVGLIAGYAGGIVDEILMRFTDMLLVLPQLPLLIVLIAVLGTSQWNLILLIGVLGWMGFARTVRSQTLSLKERPFVEAAKAVGSGTSHILTRHILPNVMSLVYVTLALSVPNAIISEAALSWLGLFDPKVVSWGRMLYDAQWNEGVERLWWIVPPGISIALVSLSFILLGYALDEILNPRLRRRR